MPREALLTTSQPTLPAPGSSRGWGRLTGASAALAVAELARQAGRPVLLLAEDPRQADQLEAELRFFAGPELPVRHFVEWETLPWDAFSPYQDITSQRLQVLADLEQAAQRDERLLKKIVDKGGLVVVADGVAVLTAYNFESRGHWSEA